MARGPGHRPLILVRWILLGLLLAAGAVVLGIYLDRGSTSQTPRSVADDPERGAEPPGPRSVADDPESPVDSRDVVLSAEGFEYEVIEEGVTLFHIRAERMISDREDRFVLEKVELKTEEAADSSYAVSSDRAIYDLDTRNARLEGSVVMTGPNGVELRGEVFELERSGRILESRASPVAYRIPGGYTGTAEEVRINLQRNNLRLRDRVVIDSPPGADPPVRLTAERMFYREDEGLLRVEGDVVFTRGQDRLSSRRLAVRFEGSAEGGEVVRFVQARWDVYGRLALASNGDRSGSLGFTAETMGVAFDGAGKQVEKVVFEGGDGPATMRLDDGTGLLQTLRSQSIITDFADGAVSRLESPVPAVLEERLAVPGAPPLRRLCGDTLSASVGPDGGLGDVELDGTVDYNDSRMSASGDRLRGDPARELLLTGAPARLVADDNDVAAPEIVYSRSGGTLIANGGVRATGLDRSGVELASGDDRATVLVTADQAIWSDQPPEVTFVGTVRAWQGESFLFADRLQALEGGERLVGQGSVKTVWKPRPGEEEQRKPVEVSAGRVVYERSEGRLNYTEQVRAHEAGRTMKCNDLEVFMDAERRIDSLLCRGAVVVEDPLNGRTVRGGEARYTPGDGLALITGAPVVMVQRDGTEIEGRRLRYELDTGQVSILSEPRTSEPEAGPQSPEAQDSEAQDPEAQAPAAPPAPSPEPVEPPEPDDG